MYSVYRVPIIYTRTQYSRGIKLWIVDFTTIAVWIVRKSIGLLASRDQSRIRWESYRKYIRLQRFWKIEKCVIFFSRNVQSSYRGCIYYIVIFLYNHRRNLWESLWYFFFLTMYRRKRRLNWMWCKGGEPRVLRHCR